MCNKRQTLAFLYIHANNFLNPSFFQSDTVQCSHDFEKEPRIEIWRGEFDDDAHDYFKYVILKWYPDDKDRYSSPKVCYSTYNN